MTKRTQETINCYILTMDLSRLKPEYVCITDEQVEFLNEVIKSKNPQNKVTPKKRPVKLKLKSEELFAI